MNVTRIWCKYPGQGEHLINEITPTSKFESVDWPKNADRLKHETQREVAERIIEGWKMMGNKPIGTTFRIEHADKAMMTGPSLDETCRKAGIELAGFA